MIAKFTNFLSFKLPFIVLVILINGFGAKLNATEYVVDNSASKVNWEAKKVTGKHHGVISIKRGSVIVTDSKISGGTIVIDMKSMINEDLTNTDMNKKLMGHLASDDFFSIEKFPESEIVIKKVTSLSGGELSFLADLTIKGVTNPVEFNTRFSLEGNKLHAEGVITVNRTLYGIKYRSGSFFPGIGDKMIYDDFTISFNVIALKN